MYIQKVYISLTLLYIHFIFWCSFSSDVQMKEKAAGQYRQPCIIIVAYSNGLLTPARLFMSVCIGFPINIFGLK